MPEIHLELKPDLQIAGPAYERNQGGVADLYIHMGELSFSCAIANPSAKRFVAFEHWDLDKKLSSILIKGIFDGSKLLSKPESFRKTTCITESAHSIFVPEPLFDKSNMVDQLELCYGDIPNNLSVAFEEIPLLGVVSCHTSNASLNDTIGDKYRHVQFHSASAVRLAYLASVSGPGKDALILVTTNNTTMQITAVRSSALLFNNSFQFNTPEELTYYLLLVLEQLKLSPEAVDVFFAGDASKADPAYLLACKYITNCRLSGLPSVFTYEPEFSFLDGCKHFNLFCGPVCVS
ncbi:MAG: DUF3822 family protein [Bacteroidota bacterium]|jgi:hypothetical protein